MFTSDAQGFTLTDSMLFDTYSDNLRVDRLSQQLVYRNAESLPPSVYYWKLPAKYLGDKVTAYGGSLSYSSLYEPGVDTSTNAYPDVEISVSVRM